jgi:hypothetical protein
MAQFDVFISHDTRDSQMATWLHDILNRVGFAPYVYELYPQYRKPIPEAIRETMQMCSVCLVLLTENGIGSLWVHQELGLAYGYKKIIITALQGGVAFSSKGFMELVPHVKYDASNKNIFAYETIFALRAEAFGHGRRPGLKLQCPQKHKGVYTLPSTDEINEAIKELPTKPLTWGPAWGPAASSTQQVFVFNCSQCSVPINVSPWTFEELP